MFICFSINNLKIQQCFHMEFITHKVKKYISRNIYSRLNNRQPPEQWFCHLMKTADYLLIITILIKKTLFHAFVRVIYKNKYIMDVKICKGMQLQILICKCYVQIHTIFIYIFIKSFTSLMIRMRCKIPPIICCHQSIRAFRNYSFTIAQLM